MTKKKKETLMEAAKETVGLGIVSGAGLGAMGAMSNIPGMPSQASGITGVAGAGLTLVNVGRMAKTGMTLADTMKGASKTKSKKKKTELEKKLWG